MNKLAINAVFSQTAMDNDAEELIRIIWIDQSEKYMQYVSLSKDVAMLHPIKVEKFKELVDNGFLGEAVDPFARIIDEENIPESYKAIRDKKWQVVSLIWDRNKERALLKMERPKLFEEAAKLFNVHPMEVRRMMSRFWQRGMIPNALLPDYDKRGSKGRQKAETPNKRGRPREYYASDSEIQGINVTEDLKGKIRNVIDLFYLSKKKPTIKDTYQQLLSRHFSDVKYEDGVRKHVIWEAARIPSYHQFYYWFKQFTDITSTVLRRDGDREFALKFRELLGDTEAESFGPGFKYQIDATIADVYVVSVKNPNYIIGRPVLYMVMDIFSRLIVGIYVGVEGPSWVGAMMALDNVIADKVEFCKNYGVDIAPEDWPASLLPERLLADRGEFEGKCPEGMIANLGISLENTPPYRGDLKGIVERHFRTTNDRIKTRLPGAVRKAMKERGGPDYRLDAKLNIDEFTRIMLAEVRRHNKSVMEQYSKSIFEIRDSVEPIPLSIWNWGKQNRRCGFVARNRDFVRISLMPKENATITRQGIRFHNIYYSCDLAIKEGWFINPKRSSIKVAYDPRKLSHIYIPDANGQGFTKCYPVANSKDFGNMTFGDYMMLKKYLEEEKALLKPSKNQLEIDIDAEIRKIVKQAKNKVQREDLDLNKSERLRNIHENRERERNERREQESFELGAKSFAQSGVKNYEDKKGKMIEFNDVQRKNQSDYEDEILELLKRERNERIAREK
ncbi:MAG: transposase protein [Firmicutes bacterium]|nr:transposase protein [Bacillota bacterium]